MIDSVVKAVIWEIRKQQRKKRRARSGELSGSSSGMVQVSYLIQHRRVCKTAKTLLKLFKPLRKAAERLNKGETEEASLAGTKTVKAMMVTLLAGAALAEAIAAIGNAIYSISRDPIGLAEEGKDARKAAAAYNAIAAYVRALDTEEASYEDLDVLLERLDDIGGIWSARD